MNPNPGNSAVPDAAGPSDCFPPGADEVAFLRQVSEFCRAEVDPHTRAWDMAGEFPKDLFARAGAAGLLGMLSPRDLGGQGLSVMTYARAVIEIARHDAAFAMNIAAANALAIGHIVRFGTDKQRRQWVPALVQGQRLAAWALTEPAAGSDAAALQTTGKPCEDGWRVTGHKLFITGGSGADVVVVMAVTGTLENGRHEISAFLIPKAGVEPVRKIPTLGMCASDTAEIRFENARAELLGERGEGQRQLLTVLERGRIGIAALAVGIGRAALEAGVRWVTERQVFRRPLADQGMIQAMFADSATELDAATLLALRAAALQDAGRATPQESAMAKLYASEAACRVCDRMLQVHGGRGYSRDFPLERHFRDAKLCTIGEGASEVLRLVIARQLLRGETRS